MLDELHVRDIALIEDADIEFSPKLTVLTGETGAGKTALLSALRLICGQRADSKVVRDGASEAIAEARFEEGGEEHVVRRRLSAQGRSRCAVDGAMATVSELSRAAAFIRVHSQHEQVQLLQEATQLSYLDGWISPDRSHLRPYLDARAAYLEAKAAFDELDRADADAAQQLEFMRFTAEQIAKVAPVEGEYEQLEAELPRLQNAEQLAVAVNTALARLHDDAGALDTLAEALFALQRQEGIDAELDAIASRLSDLLSELEDTARDLGSYAEDVSFEPETLEETLSRLDALSGLMRRFGPGMEQVFETWRAAQRAIERGEASPERLEQARAQADRAEQAYREAARELAALRHEKARAFCEKLAASVHELAMEDASFEFTFAELPFERWGQAGSERVELGYRPAPSSRLRPLGQIASGGELSRILLAIECVYRDAAPADAGACTIVFDEVDAGIGGATGSAVAQRIAQLSEHAQVIVVTHLPQVAACADVHYVVKKDRAADGTVRTACVQVEGGERVAEVARMLAGTVDDAALAHAERLLEEARG